MKRWLFLAVFLFIASPAWAQGLCPGIIKNMQAYAHETLSVDGTAVVLTSSVYAPAGKAPQMAVITVEGANLRVWSDGTAPTAGVGQLIQTGAFYVCGQSNVQNLKLIAASGTGTISVQYYQ